MRRRFARLLLFAAVVPALLFSGIMLWQQYRSERVSLGERTGLSSGLTASSIDDYVQSRLAGLTLLAQSRDAPLADWSGDLDRLRDAYPGLVSAVVVGTDGRIVTYSPRDAAVSIPPQALDVSDRDYFRLPASTLQPYVSDAFRGRVIGEDPLVAIASPIIREGRLVGVIEASVLVDTFIRQRGEAFHSRGYEMLLLDRRNRVISATRGLPYGFLDAVDEPRLTVDATMPAGTTRTRFERRLLDGNNAYVARTRMSSGWTLVLIAPDRPLLLAIGMSTGVLLAVLLLASLGVLAATWLQLRGLAEGTGRLLESLRKFALGEPMRLESNGRLPEELQPVADAIGDLSGRLNDAYGELSDALESQRTLAVSLQRVVDERDQEIAHRTADLRQAVEELERIASIDALTGTLNVRGFRRAVNALVEDPAHDATSMGAVIIDVDHFKAYNDRYGHPAGDTVLKRVTGIMLSLLRGPDDVMARVGGEEFAILLQGADVPLAIEVAARLREAVRNAGIPHADGVDGVVTISAGVAVQPSPQFMDRLLSQADEALYRAKRQGRDRVAS